MFVKNIIMDKQEFFVGVTHDYEMFKFLDTNREPNSRIIAKLEKSIQEHGVQIPIIVNKEKEIVDGQHRFWALRKLGYKIPYIVSHTWKDDYHTIEINNTGSRWNAMDFANYAAESGNLDVDEALKIAKKWEKETQRKLRPITTLEILMEGRAHAGLKTKLKNLSYKIDRDRGFQVYETLNEMSNHPMKANPFSARIARTIKVLNYDENDLDEQIIAEMCQSNYITTYDSETDQLEYFRDLYAKSKNRMNSKQ